MNLEQKIFSINGFKIAYTDTGPSDGRIVFCVHGLLSNGRDYDALARNLAGQGYRVIAMDLPGRGKSDGFPDQELYVLPNYIPSCLALIKHVTDGKEFDWLGVSLGGLIGMALHNMRGIKIERLIIVDIGPEVPGEALDIVATYAKAPTQYETKEEAVAFLKTRCASWGIVQSETWDHLIAHNIVEQSDGSYRLHYDPAIGEALPEKNDTISFWPLWQKIKQPVLLIRGEQSVILPERIAMQMALLYKGKRMDTITFEECGHVPNLMEVYQIKKVAEWFGNADNILRRNPLLKSFCIKCVGFFCKGAKSCL